MTRKNDIDRLYAVVIALSKPWADETVTREEAAMADLLRTVAYEAIYTEQVADYPAYDAMSNILDAALALADAILGPGDADDEEEPR